MKITIKKKIGAAATAVAIVGGAGIATAYWTSTGTGSGSATAGSDTPWVVSTLAARGDEVGSPALPLTPGGPTQTIPFQVTNNGSGVQHLFAVAVSVADTDEDDGSEVEWAPEGCSADDFSVVGAEPDIDIPAGGNHKGVVTVQMIDRPDIDQDGCKGLTVPLHLSAS